MKIRKEDGWKHTKKVIDHIFPNGITYGASQDLVKKGIDYVRDMRGVIGTKREWIYFMVRVRNSKDTGCYIRFFDPNHPSCEFDGMYGDYLLYLNFEPDITLTGNVDPAAHLLAGYVLDIPRLNALIKALPKLGMYQKTIKEGNELNPKRFKIKVQNSYYILKVGVNPDGTAFLVLPRPFLQATHVIETQIIGGGWHETNMWRSHKTHQIKYKHYPVRETIDKDFYTKILQEINF